MSLSWRWYPSSLPSSLSFSLPCTHPYASSLPSSHSKIPPVLPPILPPLRPPLCQPLLPLAIVGVCCGGRACCWLAIRGARRQGAQRRLHKHWGRGRGQFRQPGDVGSTVFMEGGWLEWCWSSSEIIISMMGPRGASSLCPPMSAPQSHSFA